MLLALMVEALGRLTILAGGIVAGDVVQGAVYVNDPIEPEGPFTQELDLKKKKLIENAPWVATFAFPPIWMLLDTAWAEVVKTPFKEPRTYPEKEAKPPTPPVCAS